MTSVARYSTANRPRPGLRLGRPKWPAFLGFALPALIFVGIFFVAPLLFNIPLSFSNWTSYRNVIVWNGFNNFRTLYNQGYLINAIWVTLAYSVVAMLVQNVVSLSLACDRLA